MVGVLALVWISYILRADFDHIRPQNSFSEVSRIAWVVLDSIRLESIEITSQKRVRFCRGPPKFENFGKIINIYWNPLVRVLVSVWVSHAVRADFGFIRPQNSFSEVSRIRKVVLDSIRPESIEIISQKRVRFCRGPPKFENLRKNLQILLWWVSHAIRTNFGFIRPQSSFL